MNSHFSMLSMLSDNSLQRKVLYCIPLLYKLTELNLYYIPVALPTWCIYKVHVFGYIDCTYYKYNTCNKYQV